VTRTYENADLAALEAACWEARDHYLKHPELFRFPEPVAMPADPNPFPRFRFWGRRRA
jgi:hypothetical protein